MPADHQLSQANLDSPLEIIICREFAAPRELVWLAWTDPHHAGRWWGPAGFTTTTHSMDFRPSGSWRYTMHGPDGRDYGNRIQYIEIDQPSRLIYTLCGEGSDESVSFRTEVLFECVGENGRGTKVTMRLIFPTAEARDFVIHDHGAVEGGKQHLANLEDYLASIASGDDQQLPFSISHVFNASREQVWEAWTDQDHLRRWFGPKGSTILHATVDLRVGGMFHYCISHPHGMEMWGRWVFRTIRRPDRLEFISSFSNAGGELTPAPFPGLDDFPRETWTTVTLVEHAGKSRGTLVTIEARPFNGTKAERDFFTAFHGSMSQGWTGTLKQLSEFLGD
ncbi:MAG: SRPBCC family protein [Planctomycetaceae bacterium]|nr:SRPBCC family protein [Planctomycetaceae bacterium]